VHKNKNQNNRDKNEKLETLLGVCFRFKIYILGNTRVKNEYIHSLLQDWKIFIFEYQGSWEKNNFS